MTSDLRLTLALWRSSQRRGAGERAYLAYAFGLSALVLLAPLARALALVAVDPSVVAALAPSAGSVPLLVVIASCWILALATGGVRGPIVMPPFLAHALTRGPLPRRAVFRAPLLRAVLVAGVVGIVAAVIPVLGWHTTGLASALGSGLFVVLGASVGAATALFWLLGQLAPASVRALLALGVLAIALVSVVAPAVLVFTPLGWIALAYGAAGLSPFAAVFVSVTLLGGFFAFRALGVLDARTVLAQSHRWDAAVSRAGLLELDLAAREYLPVPRRGRHRRAVYGGPLATRILVADAVAATRTPSRLFAGTIALSLGGLALGAALAGSMPWLGALAGVAAYAGAGPVTDGIRQLVESSAAIALYGVSDLAMLSAHTVFPLLVATGVIALAAVLVAGVGAPLAAPMLAAGAVVARVAAALKPPMPLALLAPVPTPAGDLAVIGRIAWATDAVLLTAGLGAVAVAARGLSWLAVAVLAVMGAVAARRWRRR